MLSEPVNVLRTLGRAQNTLDTPLQVFHSCGFLAPFSAETTHRNWYKWQ